MAALDYEAFAREWQDGWNSHDLDRILAHYTDDVVFRSRKAQAMVGDGVVKGKRALRDYWSRALSVQPDLSFSVEAVFAGVDMAVIQYRNHRGVRAVETLMFDEAGLIWQAAACHEPPR